MEDYGNLTLDESIVCAWNTLQAVREGCGRLGEEVVGEGKRRARVIVDILESRYKEALGAKETLPSKVNAGVRFLEELLGDFESRASASIDRKLDRAKRGIEAVEHAKEILAESIERAISAAKERGYITYEELPTPCSYAFPPSLEIFDGRLVTKRRAAATDHRIFSKPGSTPLDVIGTELLQGE